MSAVRRRMMGGENDPYKLPAGYTKLESVYKGNWVFVTYDANFPIYVKFKLAVNLNYQGILFGRSDGFRIVLENNTIRCKTANILSVEDNQVVEVEAGYNPPNINMKINETTYINGNTTNVYSDKLLLGAGWTNNNSGSQFTLYSFELYDYDSTTNGPGAIRSKLIPCKEESTNTYGVYDVITDTFYSGNWRAQR